MGMVTGTGTEVMVIVGSLGKDKVGLGAEIDYRFPFFFIHVYLYTMVDT